MAKRMSSEERREQAAEAALKLAENGLSAVTLTGVAEEMGVVPSALYRHFGSKEDLVFAVLAHMRKLIEGNVATALAGATDPLDALRRLAKAQGEMLHARPGILSLMFSEEITRSAPQYREGVENTSGRFRQMVRDIIEKGQAAGVIRSDATSNDLMFAFLGTILPPIFLSHLTGGELDFRIQIERNWRLFMESAKAGDAA
ncbi:TetR/AcrR family transcriptional regulator [Salidesulfovibrio brasiliensis]|uniref:TetR/AcrR family transcriptional regulator n=1 Tax=Salidesulfovibrio brasiliensis TaxID=221711 RepID=UPI0006CF9C38|nr:TetR/AcrR family transcriptional regulator [Salidesulfovibrio brasiliensis]